MLSATLENIVKPPSPDNNPPTVGDPIISASNITQDSFNLSWNLATDAETDDATIYYILYESASSNIGTIADMKANGSIVAEGFELNSASITGKNAETPYYHNVLARDANGNELGYTEKETTTSAEPVAQDSEAGDIAALEAIYTSTNGDSWNNNTGWAASGMSLDPAPYGVTVETINSELRVTRIKLNGTTNYEVDNGTNLKGTDGVYGGNNLTGTLPTDILGNLKQCVYFNVKQNWITGSIPDDLFTLPEMTHCLLNGMFEELNFDQEVNQNKVRSLSVTPRSNQFTGTIPNTFPAGSKIEYIEIAGQGASDIDDGTGYPDSLTGVIPDSILNCANLQGLTCGFNSLTDFPASGFPTTIVYLHIHRNAMSGTALNGRLDNLVNLHALDLSTNRHGGSPPNLRNMDNFRFLWANKNNFTGSFPSYMLDDDTVLPILNQIELSWQSFDATPCPELNRDGMVAIDINGCNLTGNIPVSWSTHSNGLSNFGIGWNSLTGQFPDMSNKGGLRFIEASSNSLTGTLPDIDGTNTNCNYIHFGNNNMDQYISAYQSYADLAVSSGLGTGGIDVNSNSFSSADLQDLRDALLADGNSDVLNDSNQTP